MKPTAAPARFPYREHRTLAEVDRETREKYDYDTILRLAREKAA